MGTQNRRNKNVQLQYLTIFENQILCLKTDGNWYCNCSTLKFNGKCEVCLFIKHFEELHEISTEHYLWKEKKEFYVLVRKILLLQENTLQNGKVKEILIKEYQYKNSYQCKYCNPKNIYEPWYLKSTINSYDSLWHCASGDKAEAIKYKCFLQDECQ